MEQNINYDVIYNILLHMDNVKEMNELTLVSKLFHQIMLEKYFWQQYFLLHNSKDAKDVIKYLSAKANGIYGRTDIKFHFTTKDITNMNVVCNFGIYAVPSKDIHITIIFWKDSNTYDLYVNVDGKVSYKEINYQDMELIIQYIYFHFPNKKLKYQSYKNYDNAFKQVNYGYVL